MGKVELDLILEETAVIEVTCEFCGESHRFNEKDVETLIE
jgi:redox-regulated HSP33 family molecular chaperone